MKHKNISIQLNGYDTNWSLSKLKLKLTDTMITKQKTPLSKTQTDLLIKPINPNLVNL